MIFFTILVLTTLFAIYLFIKIFCKNGKCCEFIRMVALTAVAHVRKSYQSIRKFFEK